MSGGGGSDKFPEAAGWFAFGLPRLLWCELERRSDSCFVCLRSLRRAGIRIGCDIRREYDGGLGMKRTGSRHCEKDVVGSACLAVRDPDKYAVGPFRTELGSQKAGFGADAGRYVNVADVGRYGAFGKIFRIDRIASGSASQTPGIASLPDLRQICADSRL